MNSATLRLRYTQFFALCLLGFSLYITTQSLAGGISQFESHLWGRPLLITSFTNLRLTLGDRVFPQAVVGKDGWLEYGKELDTYQNADKPSLNALKTTQQKLQELYEELRKRNITLILVIPPNKATIYPDKLPDGIQPPNPKSKLAAFTTYIQQHGPPVLVDLRPALLDGRKQQDIYYKTDTHWNAYGAFIGYTEIMRALSKTYPQLAPKSLKDFKIITSQPYAHDIPQIMGATTLLEPKAIFDPKENDLSWVTLNDDNPVPLQVSTTSKKDLPALLMYVDSYGDGMKDFIAPHFSKATFILTSTEYPDALSLKTIDIVKPDVVIVEVVERFFDVQLLDYIVNH
ncbi:MAG: hypothetical protein WA821_15570, partial [Anaerolineales bacterium]